MYRRYFTHSFAQCYWNMNGNEETEHMNNSSLVDTFFEIAWLLREIQHVLFDLNFINSPTISAQNCEIILINGWRETMENHLLNFFGSWNFRLFSFEMVDFFFRLAQNQHIYLFNAFSRRYTHID